MFTIILLSIGLPVLAGTVYLTLRNRRPELVADMRGIALQTVIVIVVLLAIAGAVAGVLMTRGTESVAELQTTNVERVSSKADAKSKAECDVFKGTWNATTKKCT